jgi:hypothetical protein
MTSFDVREPAIRRAGPAAVTASTFLPRNRRTGMADAVASSSIVTPTSPPNRASSGNKIRSLIELYYFMICITVTSHRRPASADKDWPTQPSRSAMPEATTAGRPHRPSTSGPGRTIAAAGDPQHAAHSTQLERK